MAHENVQINVGSIYRPPPQNIYAPKFLMKSKKTNISINQASLQDHVLWDYDTYMQE